MVNNEEKEEIMDCQHIPKNIVERGELYFIKKSMSICDVCEFAGPNLWACCADNCKFVGCSQKKHDHGNEHYQLTQHSVSMNLKTFRVWCHICKKELKLPGSYSAKEMRRFRDSFTEENKHDGKSVTAADLSDRRSPQVSSRKPNELAQNGIPANQTFISAKHYNAFPNTFRTLTAIPSFLPSELAKSSSSGLTGLRNLGNTCYMNAAIQSLSNCPQLTNYFLCLMRLHETSLRKRSVTRCFTKLMCDMWTKQYGSIAASDLIDVFKERNYTFRGHQQQDTQEFLRALVDNLQQEMREELPVIQDCEMQPVILKEAGGDASSKSPSKKQQSNEADTDHNVDVSPMDVDDSDELQNENDELLDVNNQPCLSHNELHSSFNDNSNNHTPKANPQSSDDENCGTPRSPAKRRRTITSSSCNSPRKSQEKVATYIKVQREVISSSLLSDVFDGAVRSSVQCRTCKMVSHSEETFQDLSISIPNKDDTARIHGLPPTLPPSHGIVSISDMPKGYSAWIWTFWDRWRSAFSNWMWGPEVHLNDCLSTFFSADELKGDNMYSCEKCAKLRNGVKDCKLVKLPEILCIHLKRFRLDSPSYSTKISSVVKFPLQGLDVSRYLARDSSSRIRTYDLVSVVVHIGNHGGGGHYTSFTKNPINQKWYEFDDGYVTQVDESAVQKAEAYVLFYRKHTDEDTEKLRQEMYGMEKEPKLISFYVAAQWVHKFVTFAEPGPIDNRYFLCPHGDVDPSMHANISDRVCRISEQMWHLLHKKFGGGPVVTRLQSCPICEKSHALREAKRNDEYRNFVRLTESAAKNVLPTFYISMNWFRAWQNFICKKEKEPPDEIDNRNIVLEKGGKWILNKSSDYGEIPLDAWQYLVSQYQGGPPVPAGDGPEVEIE